MLLCSPLTKAKAKRATLVILPILLLGIVLFVLQKTIITYSHDFTIHVIYADGDTAVLQWSSWSYGIVACPILISMGSGPPGQLKIVP